PQAVMWACTSGSFVYGLEGAEQQAHQLASEAGVPAAITSQAFKPALEALEVKNVAVAASDPEPVATLLAEYLAAADVEISGISGGGIGPAAEVGGLGSDRALDLVLRRNEPAAHALRIPDTAMRTTELLPQLEAHAGKPVVTANQVTIWHGLRLSGAPTSNDQLGALFAM